MPEVCIETLAREKRQMPNDPYERVNSTAQAAIINAASFFEGVVNTDETPTPSEGERLALKRAMARFLIDSGIASFRGWVP